jgi:hypothetical protein
MRKPILCVDFDGVIHSYSSGWKGEDNIPDPPVPGALKWLLRACEVFHVCIYSSRSKSPAGRAAMARWLEIHAPHQLDFEDSARLMSAIEFSCEKPAAFLTIDDRAICFDGDWSALDPFKLAEFKPWNKRRMDGTVERRK